MVEPTKREVDRSLEDSMNLFRRAKVGKVAPVEPQHPEKILLVLDGSSQDPLGIALARNLHRRLECEVAVLDARESVDSNELATQTAEELAGTALPKPQGDSFQQILDAVEASESQLIIVPCPFGRDLESVGPDSVGTVIDVLLARSPAPILVVRRPFEPGGKLFHRVLLTLAAENHVAPTAAAWAVGLVALETNRRLVLVLDKESCENIQSLMRSLAPELEVNIESLAAALAKTYTRLHRGLQKAATDIGFEYELTMQEDDPAMKVLDDETSHPLLVVALERTDHASQGYVQSRIRLSPNCVLVVPG